MLVSDRFSQQLRDELPYALTHIQVQELREGQAVSQCFLVRSKIHRVTRNSDPYLEIILADRSGTIPARAWTDATLRYGNDFEHGDFVFVEGRTESYRGVLQVNVSSIRRIDLHESEQGKILGFDVALLTPTSEYNIDDMWNELHRLAAEISPAALSRLTVGLLDENEEAFRKFPAAISFHHAYIGGLLEHSLEVARGASEYAKSCSILHRGLVTAGAILHDIGKIREMAHPVSPKFTFDGQMFGHLLIGRDMVRAHAAKIGLADSRLSELLEHIIISHHGEREFGAAEHPKTAEAMAVYYFDNLSARLNMIHNQRTADGNESEFTDWQDRPLGRALFKGEIPDA